MEFLSNPEFKKNLWLEITPLRVAAMVSIIFSVLYITWMFTEDWVSVGNMAVFIFILTGILWGSRQTAESILSEIRDKTWDFQRMSAIAPWQMVWGKILGSTVYQWIGSAISLFVFAISLHLRELRQPKPYLLISFYILTAYTAQSLAFLMALHFSSRSAGRSALLGRSGSFLYMAAGTMTGIIIMAYGSESQGTVYWYGNEYSRLPFVFIITSLSAAWITLASYRLMRLQLKRKANLLFWPLFIIFLSFFPAGFFINPYEEGSVIRITFRYLWNSVFVIAGLIWFTLLTEEKNIIIFNRLWRLSKTLLNAVIRFFHKEKSNPDFRGPYPALPLWFVTWILFIFFIIIFYISILLAYFSDYTFYIRESQAAFYVYGLFFLVLRDTFIIIFYTIRPDSRRPETAAIITLIILYGIVPLLLQSAGLNNSVFLFWPVPGDEVLFSIMAWTLQAFLAIGLTASRIRELQYNEKSYQIY